MKGVSIVVCTYNGKSSVGEMLKHLSAQEREGFGLELIVVDNNSTDGTYEYVEKKWKEYGAPYLLKLLKEPQAGKFNASLKGFGAAEYDYILVCDDDNFLASDYCMKAFNIFENNPEVGVIGGFGIPVFENTKPIWFPDFQTVFACGPQYKKAGIIDDTLVNIWGAGMAFRKKIWQYIRKLKHEFFLNELRSENVSSGGDDTELSILAKWLGYSLYYDETMIFKHFMPEKRMTFEYLKIRFRGLGKSRIYLRAYDYCYSKNELPDKGLKIPFWQDKLAYRKREKNRLFLYVLFLKEKPSNFERILKYQSLIGEINEIKNIKENYIKIYETLFSLKNKIIAEKLNQ